MPAKFTIPTIYTAVDKVSSVVNKMGNSVTAFASRAEAGVARANRAFRRFTPVLSETAKQFISFASTAAISAAIIGGISFSVQSLKDYETALASTQAVTGTTDAEFVAFRKGIDQVAKDTKKSAVDVAKSFEIIGSAKPELLASADALSAVTKASITLSKASRDDLATSALNLTGVMNQFSLAADQSERTINVLSAGAKVGSASISNVGESMKNFGSVAAGANISLEQSVALVEVLGKFSVFGAEAGTKLRGSVLKLQQAGVGYASGQFNINDALLEAQKRISKLSTEKARDAALTKMFGAENISTGRILLGNIELFKQYTLGVTNTNVANEMAAVNSRTLTIAIEEAKAAWVNLITSSSQAGSALSTARSVVVYITDNLGTLVSIGTKVILFFAAWKAILIASSVALGAYNIVLGITGAVTGIASIAIAKSSIAMKAYAITTKIVTAAQWLWNAAIAGSPLFWIPAAIIAIIAVVTLVIKKWNDWGAALSVLLGPLGLVISLVQSFRRNWDLISQAFRMGGILEGIKMIGKTLLDAVLMPIQQIIGLVARITGAEWAVNAVKSIQKFRAELGVNTTSDESGTRLPTKEVINPRVTEQEKIMRYMEVNKQNVSIDINDKTGRASVDPGGNAVPIHLTSTVGF